MNTNREAIFCFGDSITKGVPGFSYLRFVDKKWKLKNRGLGGDTLMGLRKRVACGGKNSKCDRYIIQIGANDILLPYLLGRSLLWSDRIARLIKRGSVPCKDAHQFQEEYGRLISECQKKNKELLIISVPCIGEDLESSLNKKVDAYNNVLKDLTAEHGIDYVDFNSWQKTILADRSSETPYFISSDPFDVMMDSLLTAFLPIGDRLSRKRGLSGTIDGCHLNSLGARCLGGLVEEALMNRQYLKVKDDR